MKLTPAHAFFDKEFFQPAMQWATDQGLTLPLSALVVYDSFIHSGSILPLIRRSFPQPTPASGGDERAWTTAYVKARHLWLVGHARADVRKTQYRTRCLGEQIARANWHLEVRPIRANGVVVG
jgi:chitosanase